MGNFPDFCRGTACIRLDEENTCLKGPTVHFRLGRYSDFHTRRSFLVRRYSSLPLSLFYRTRALDICTSPQHSQSSHVFATLFEISESFAIIKSLQNLCSNFSRSSLLPEQSWPLVTCLFSERKRVIDTQNLRRCSGHICVFEQFYCELHL